MNKSIALTIIKSKFQKHVAFKLEKLDIFIHLKKDKSYTKWMGENRYAELEKDSIAYSELTDMLLKNVRKHFVFKDCIAIDAKIDFIKKEINCEMYYTDAENNELKIKLNNVY